MKVTALMALGASSFLVLFSAGCDTISREQEKAMNHTADTVVAKMVLTHTGLQARMGTAPGYLVVKRSGSGIPMVGKRGRGVLTCLQSQERINVRVTELEIDGGWGVGDYTGLYLFRRPEDFAQAFTNNWSAENAGSIYIYAEGEPSARYAVKRIAVSPR